MYPYALIGVLMLLPGCASTPVPAHDPEKAWVEFFTRTGKVVMAERLDGQRLDDGRYFQVEPGRHELMVRFDYEVIQSMLPMGQPSERICYITLHYDSFQAGQRYRLEARNMAFQTYAYLYDPEGKKVAIEDSVNCLF